MIRHANGVIVTIIDKVEQRIFMKFHDKDIAPKQVE